MLDGLSLAGFYPLYEVIDVSTASSLPPSVFSYAHHFQLDDGLQLPRFHAQSTGRFEDYRT